MAEASRWARAAALGLAVLGTSTQAPACGLEDPSSIAARRGALQLAYPQALHVGTAVWQAQLAGTLRRDVLAQRADLSPEARAQLRLVLARVLLDRLVTRLNAAPTQAERPDVAIVLVGPVLWSRIAGREGGMQAQTHVDGPEPGDVVAVTDLAVVEALSNGSLGVARAVDAGVLRLYGKPADVSATYGWLVAATAR